MIFEMNNGTKRWHTDALLWARLIPIAREMRREPTEAENLLWQNLRRHLLGFRFRRQHSIERFIVDFYCAKARLVIEVDGGIHQYQVEEDAVRKEYLESRGLKLIRFPNKDILSNIDEVISRISKYLPKNV